MKIIILNLPRATTVKELEKVFSPYGDVLNCDIVLDSETGKSKGFGFAEMPKEIEAKKAIEKKITKIYFDRGIYKYHGRVKVFADTLRKNGMEF